MRYPLFQLGNLTRVLDLITQANSIVDNNVDADRSAQCALFLGHVFWLMGRHQEALVQAERSIKLGEELSNSDLVKRGQFFAGLAHMGLGNLSDTLARMRDTAHYFRARPPEVSRGLGSLASISIGYVIRALTDLGRVDEAMLLVRSAREISDTEDALAKIITGVSEGYLYDARNDHEEAIRVLSEAYSLSQTAQVPLMTPIVQMYLGGAYINAARPAEARVLLHEAVEQAAKMGLMYYHPVRLALLARAELALGDRTRAKELAESALALAVKQGERTSEAFALVVLSDLMRDSPETSAEASRLRQRADEISRQTGFQPKRGTLHPAS